MTELNEKLNRVFAGKVVRKDLTKKIKEGANVPVYVLEYLLGMYCATDDDRAVDDGVETVKRILANNLVRSDEAEKIKSKIKEKGIYTVIDKCEVRLDDKRDVYVASFSNLGIKDVYINPQLVLKYEKQLVGGIWCIVKLSYHTDEGLEYGLSWTITSFDPIQVPNIDISIILEGRKKFEKEEWIDLLIRSMGIEGVGTSNEISLAELISLYSAGLKKSVETSIAVLGTITIAGTINKITNLADVLQVCLDSGAKKVLLPANAASDLGTVPSELASKFSLLFYSTPEDATLKALGA